MGWEERSRAAPAAVATPPTKLEPWAPQPRGQLLTPPARAAGDSQLMQQLPSGEGAEISAHGENSA